MRPGLNFLCAAAPSDCCNVQPTDELLSPPRSALRLAGRARRCPCATVVLTAVQRLLGLQQRGAGRSAAPRSSAAGRFSLLFELPFGANSCEKRESNWL